MRDVLLAFGLVSAWLVGTPLLERSDIAPQAQAAVAQAPDWLSIPLDAAITEIGPTAAPDMGYLSAVSTLSGPSVVKSMKTRLALQGFEIRDRTTEVDRATGAASVFEASNPTDGRLAIAVVLDTPTGALLRIDFSRSLRETL